MPAALLHVGSQVIEVIEPRPGGGLHGRGGLRGLRLAHLLQRLPGGTLTLVVVVLLVVALAIVLARRRP